MESRSHGMGPWWVVLYLSGGDSLLPEFFPCSLCGQKPEMKTDRPEGRMRDVYRATCTCEQGSSHRWSVSDFAAIRLWNEIVTAEKPNVQPVDKRKRLSDC
jgi:hypothetical protein